LILLYESLNYLNAIAPNSELAAAVFELHPGIIGHAAAMPVPATMANFGRRQSGQTMLIKAM
jgi:hypothetical protein